MPEAERVHHNECGGIVKRKLTIVVEEGNVSTVVSDGPDDFADLEIEIVNYDVEGEPIEYLSPVRQPNGKYENAFVSATRVERSTIYTDGRQ